MSEKQARARRKQTASEQNGDGGNPVPTQENPPPPPMEYPAILVMRIPGDKPGEEHIEIGELNGIDPLSIPTVLRKAASLKEQFLGL